MLKVELKAPTQRSSPFEKTIMIKASDIMTKEVAMIRGSATVADAIQLMQERGCHAFVVDRRHGQDAYGIVTETDIVYKVAALGKNPGRVRVYEIMTKPCIVINPDLGVEYIARLFAENGLSRAPVIQKELLGIISLSDIVVKGLPRLAVMPALESAVLAAIEAARRICADQGPTSIACRNAWDQVDRMQAELAHQRQEHLDKTAFESFAEEYPEVMESSLYETWCSG